MLINNVTDPANDQWLEPNRREPEPFFEVGQKGSTVSAKDLSKV